MTVLNVAYRPAVYFDVMDKQHRRWFADFLRRRSWGHCPVQFYLEQGYSDVPAMIQDKLTAWYLTREFREAVPTLDRHGVVVSEHLLRG